MRERAPILESDSKQQAGFEHSYYFQSCSTRSSNLIDFTDIPVSNYNNSDLYQLRNDFRDDYCTVKIRDVYHKMTPCINS